MNFIENQNSNEENEIEINYENAVSAINFIFVLLAIACFTSFILASTTEPGIIPREQDSSLKDNQFIYQVANKEQKTKHVINKKKLHQKLRRLSLHNDTQNEGGTQSDQESNKR